MGEHTKLPWTVSPARTVEDTAMIVGGDRFEFGLIADVIEDADAAFIVKAVNCHEALVDLVQTLLDNDPSEPIADNGMTVLDGWRERARLVLDRVAQSREPS